MRNLEALRQRYLQSSPMDRLGGLAANLARVASFSDHPGHEQAVKALVEESKFLIEWIAADMDLETLEKLADMQRQLAIWYRRWPAMWADEAARSSLRDQAGRWAEEMLQIALRRYGQCASS
jgi:hypothetical protein